MDRIHLQDTIPSNILARILLDPDLFESCLFQQLVPSCRYCWSPRSRTTEQERFHQSFASPTKTVVAAGFSEPFRFITRRHAKLYYRSCNTCAAQPACIAVIFYFHRFSYLKTQSEYESVKTQVFTQTELCYSVCLCIVLQSKISIIKPHDSSYVKMKTEPLQGIYITMMRLDLQQVSLAATTGEEQKARETCNTWHAH